MEKRPVIDLPLATSDRFFEAIGLLGLLLMIGVPLWYYGQLPDIIPQHFGPNGEPDAYGSKGVIWTLPVIGTITYLGLAYLNRYPHIFNYPQTITPDNAEQQYRAATRMIRVLNAIISTSFAYITYGTVQMALGNQQGLGRFFLPVFLALILGTTGYYLFRATSPSRSS